ncbi:hypothetical protein [Bacillus cereus group sp. BceL008]|uniref:hypothetical protein n=1 Tax=Bacillus cereus group sp. BceL008 TaxID=3445220 RepID=UPI003F1F29ED
MRFPTHEEIENLELSELIDIMLATSDKREFQITYQEVPSYFSQKNEMGIDDVKECFNFDVQNCTYQFPYIEERDTIEVQEFLGRRTVPAKDFFWSMKTTKEEKMFGIVDVTFRINKVSVKTNEERFEQTQTVFKDQTFYYYDYEQGVYVQINKKGKENDNTLEYKRRVQLMEMCFERLEKENNAYLKLLESASIDLTERKKEPHFVAEFIEYFTNYEAHFAILEPFLPLKMLFNHTDSENYQRICSFLERLKISVSKTLTTLRKMQTNGITDDLREPQHVKEFTSFQNVKKEIQKMFSLREEKEQTGKRKVIIHKTDGFYDWDENRMYPNLIQIETSRFFKNIPGTKEQREREINEIHQGMLNNPKAVKEANENTVENEVLTQEELAKLKTLAGREKRSYLVSIISRLVRQGKIPKEQQMEYLKRYI